MKRFRPGTRVVREVCSLFLSLTNKLMQDDTLLILKRTEKSFHHLAAGA